MLLEALGPIEALGRLIIKAGGDLYLHTTRFLGSLQRLLQERSPHTLASGLLSDDQFIDEGTEPSMGEAGAKPQGEIAQYLGSPLGDNDVAFGVIEAKGEYLVEICFQGRGLYLR